MEPFNVICVITRPQGCKCQRSKRLFLLLINVQFSSNNLFCGMLLLCCSLSGFCILMCKSGEILRESICHQIISHKTCTTRTNKRVQYRKCINAMQKYAARPGRGPGPGGHLHTCMVSDVLCYEDLLDEDPVRVETRGLILEHNFNVFKTLSCDHSNAVSATGPT